MCGHVLPTALKPEGYKGSDSEELSTAGCYLVNRCRALNLLRVDDDLITLKACGATLRDARLGEGVGRTPLGRGPWGSLCHHLINLLERQALGFGHKEVCVYEGSRA
jgi:hypothetical protein